MEDFTSYRYIEAIYKTGSISAAADSMNISQPALSIRLKKTENFIGETI